MREVADGHRPRPVDVEDGIVTEVLLVRGVHRDDTGVRPPIPGWPPG